MSQMMLNPQTLAMLQQAVQGAGQPAPNPPLSQDDTAEARRQRGREEPRMDAQPPAATMTQNRPAHGSQITPALHEAGGINPQTGVQSGDLPPEHLGYTQDKDYDANVAKVEQENKTVPWTIQEERGTEGDPNHTINNRTFTPGQGPTDAAQNTPEQALAQQNMQMQEAAKHPPAAHKNFDRTADISTLNSMHKMAEDLMRPYASLQAAGADVAVPPAVQARYDKLSQHMDTLSDRLVNGDYTGGESDLATAGPATPDGQSTAPQAPSAGKPLTPDVIAQIKKMAPTVQKREQLAKQMGYTW